MQFKKLIIKNFLSIKDIEIEFEENRCYHIKGKNNIGKSNFLKAFKVLTTNLNSRSVSRYIFDGEESFYIEAHDFNHNVVRLSRGKEDYYSWVIDGVEGRVDGTAGKVPDTLKTFFNLYSDEKTKEVINLRMPRAKLLFIDSTNGENYYLLQKALRIEEYLQALKLGSSRRNEVRKSIDPLDVMIDKLTKDIDELTDYSGVLQDIEDYENAVNELEGLVSEVYGVLNDYDDLKERSKKLNALTSDFDVDHWTEVRDLVKLMSEAYEVWSDIERKEKFVKDTENMVSEFETALTIADTLKNSLDNVNLIDEVMDLSGEVGRKESLIKEVEELSNVIEEFNLIDSIELYKEGIATLDSINRYRSQVEVYKKLELDLKEAEEEKELFMKENKYCPMCKNPFDTEHAH